MSQQIFYGDGNKEKISCVRLKFWKCIFICRCKSLLLARNLPTTSVIMVYKNEQKSVLLRALYR